MNRTFVSLSFAVVLALAPFAVLSQTQQSPEQLNKKQLNSLIANAKTPADHIRIAQYYEAKAQDDLAQSSEHEQMAAQWKANPAGRSTKFVNGTVNHCEYLAKHFRADAAKMQKLAQTHQQMATEASTTKSESAGVMQRAVGK